MPARRIAIVVTPVVRGVTWLFSEPLPVLDLLFGLLGTGWLMLMISCPALFDSGNFRGMLWAPDQVWIAFLALTTSLHLFGLLRTSWMKVRTASHLLTSWYWLLVAISFSRVGLSTGIVAYGLFGLLALCSAMYMSGRPHQGA